MNIMVKTKHELAASQWNNFVPPDKISITHPWVARYFPSKLLYHDNGPAGSDKISTVDQEVYFVNDKVHNDDKDRHEKGKRNSITNPNSCNQNGSSNNRSICFRIGNGGAGYTGILRVLARRFIQTHPNQFHDGGSNNEDKGIAWVANHSRHTQAALLANIVHVAFTYEPAQENLAVAEGWARRTGVAFWDHFILVGPRENQAGLSVSRGRRPQLEDGGEDDGRGGGEDSEPCSQALRQIAARQALFHTRGDGSATFFRERALWRAAGLEELSKQSPPWLQTFAVAPYEALRTAHAHGAYLLTDRATFLTAKRDGIIPDTVCYVEGGETLLNPCAALVLNGVGDDSPARHVANVFAEWVLGVDAQAILRDYGREWSSASQPLFTTAEVREFEGNELLMGAMM